MQVNRSHLYELEIQINLRIISMSTLFISKISCQNNKTRLQKKVQIKFTFYLFISNLFTFLSYS